MRPAASLALMILLGGCTTGHVTLLPGEAGAAAGAVVVLNPRTGVDSETVDAADTRATLGWLAWLQPHPRKVDAGLWSSLTTDLPIPGSRFTLYFIEGTTDLAPESETEFERLMEEVARRPGVEVQITGHTDTLGSTEDNDKLSVERAQEVLQALVGRGLNPTITRAVGRGERELLIPTEDGISEPQNRRAEVIVR